MMFHLFKLIVCIQLCMFVSANLLDGKQTYCGHKLTSIMAVFCKGRYQSMMDMGKKRSGVIGLDDMDDFDHDPLFDDLTFEFQPLPYLRGLSAAKTIQSPARFRRSDDGWYVHRGIADECCKNACSMTTLLSYCRM